METVDASAVMLAFIVAVSLATLLMIIRVQSVLQSTECAAYVLPDAEDVTHRAQDCDCEQCARPGQLGAERRRLARRARDERSSGKAAGRPWKGGQSEGWERPSKTFSVLS